MESTVLHRLRRRTRRIAAASVALFALNWLGLALMPCAMAYAVPAGEAVVASAEALPEACAGHGATPGVRTAADASSPGAGEPCPWCAESARADGHADAQCGATPKPALDARDAKNPVTPLLIALSATVLGLLPVASVSAAPWESACPAPPPDDPLSDRYCRRLE